VRCSRCGSTRRLQRHHHNIDHPLDVIVLCQTCHTLLHAMLGTWGKEFETGKIGVIREK
jgi:hypothetical protein